MSGRQSPATVWNDASAWGGDKDCDEFVWDQQDRLSPGLAFASIIAISGLLWAAILAPLSLI